MKAYRARLIQRSYDRMESTDEADNYDALQRKKETHDAGLPLQCAEHKVADHYGACVKIVKPGT